jgi:hypothetical protein
MSVSLTDQTGYLHQEEDIARTNVYTESSYQHQQCYYAESRSVCEIEEEKYSSDLFEINHGVPLESIKEDIEGSVFSFDVYGEHQKDCVYVGVGKSESSMDALSWTLKNAIIDSNTMVFLIHIFPEIHYIPSPCKFRSDRSLIFFIFLYFFVEVLNLVGKSWVRLKTSN